ncbi:MAG TPA: SIMPL domain-containing protein [Terriglobales bacterium]|nr:SIMPL domain-containing protein [Terriglobales bacterium]
MRSPALLSAVALASLVLTSCERNSARDPRTLTVNASESVIVEPDLAILHIGFDTPAEDVKSAYADGARRSNAIVAAVKQAGISEAEIQSQSQYLYRVWSEEHKFKLQQQWTVKVPPERAAEILDIAISAGANSSGQIEWTVKDEKALDHQALDRAAARAKENAAVLANGMGAHLGMLMNVSNQFSAARFSMPMMQAGGGMGAGGGAAQLAPQLAIEPHKVTREATVSAVFAIE